MIRSSKLKTAGLLVLLAGGALLLASCNVGGAGIFYTLEKATAQSTSGIGDTRTVASMAQIAGTPGVYYAAAGKVYTASVSSTPSWKIVSPPSTAPNDICTSITSNGTTLYAVYYDPTVESQTSYYLYSATVSGSTPNTSPSWTAVSPLDSNSSFTVQKVFSVGSYVYAVVMENSPPSGAGAYDLYEINGTGGPTKISSLSGLQDPPSAGAVYDTGTNVTYWFIGGDNSGPQIYTATGTSGTDPNTMTFTTMSGEPSLPTGMVYQSIYYSTPLSTLLVSTSMVNNDPGRVYAYQSGSWSSNSIISWPSGTTETWLDGFSEYEVSTTSDAILVGAGTGGYYEIDVDPTTFSASSASSSQLTLGQPGNTTTITAGADYVSTTLASAHVIGFFNDIGTGSPASPERIFALTQSGLWLNASSSSGQRTWTLQ